MLRTAAVSCALVAAVLVLFASNAAAADRRIALVIGNGTYEHTSSLPNPEHDARSITAVLKIQGFEVFPHFNIDLKKMKRAVAEVANRARASGKATVVLFYYAGHGVQVRQSNFLIPVDAKIENEGDVSVEGLNVASILESLSDAGAAVNIVVLDACRNNPYKSSFRSASLGLARIDGPPGFLIAFSTDPGKVATDGPQGGNSPYTSSLVKALARPGLKIEEAFKAVRKEVYAKTAGQQVPWETSSLLDELYIAGNGNQTKPMPSNSTPDIVTRDRLDAEKMRLNAEADKRRAEAEIANAATAKRKAASDLERIKAETEQAIAEAAKTKAEADLARARAEANRQQQADLARSLPPTTAPIDTTTLFSPSALPSFNCGEYAAKPVVSGDRTPQSDVFCISPDASRADQRMGDFFRQRLTGMTASERADAIRNQKRWIEIRNQRCPASWADVVDGGRRSQLVNCLVRETNARSQQIQR